MNEYMITPDDELYELIYDHESKLQDYYDTIQFEMWLEEKMFEDLIASEPRNIVRGFDEEKIIQSN